GAPGGCRRRAGRGPFQAPLSGGESAGEPEIGRDEDTEEGMATKDNTARRVGFIGLGNMGCPMAANLARAGHAIQGFDLSDAACDQARAQGLAIAESVAAAVADAEVVISMLPASRH